MSAKRNPVSGTFYETDKQAAPHADATQDLSAKFAKLTAYAHDLADKVNCSTSAREYLHSKVREYGAAAPAVEEGHDNAMRCPECGSQEFATMPYDLGTDPETGYRDAGVRAQCSKCAHESDVEDFQPAVELSEAGEDATPRTPLHEALEQLIIDMRAIGKMLGEHPLASVCEDYAKRAALAASTTEPQQQEKECPHCGERYEEFHMCRDMQESDRDPLAT